MLRRQFLSATVSLNRPGGPALWAGPDWDWAKPFQTASQKQWPPGTSPVQTGPERGGRKRAISRGDCRWGVTCLFPGPTFEDHLRNLYKNTAMWRMGTQTMVFVHDSQLLRDAFNPLEFTDRPSWEIFKLNEEVA
ncbi:hypothetical protein GWK47_005700 [Chionoecetes opilio]|uniref:Uncharacterized protein n=1 Tax=Chionoecetes opilio TaxID=41210 RepID=A0A8J4YAK7_CHIOP|nr:hypothetical protein GWK47_005700 [Chionoecetes opilio]